MAGLAGRHAWFVHRIDFNDRLRSLAYRTTG